MTPILDAVRRARAARAASQPPVLSVVVPIYNVEAYLQTTLESLSAQTFRRFEVVVVDDGSPDSSADIARAWAAKDRRFRVVRQDNAGPSAARNTGIRHCVAPYLTFVDGDDTLPPDAWKHMVEMLERTGSDLCVGKLVRDNGQRQFATERMERNHVADRERLRIEQLPQILADVFPVNKVYRRPFWDELQLAFPEGLFYEDQPVMTKAFLAGTFDVLRETVYHYWIRADQSSTTQLRHRITDLSDRIVTKRMTVESVLAHGSDEVTRTFFDYVLPVDMWEYFRSVPQGSDEYWTMLRDAVREFWNPSTVPFEDVLVPVQQRLMGWFVAQDRRSDLEALIAFLDEHGVVKADVDGVQVFDHPWRTEPGIPPGCVVVDPR
ncbi:MAG: glycosyltransferase family 2 protein [Marmoricola sp.]